MKHYCGIISFVGKFDSDDVVQGLQSLQHRGHEGAGISFIENNKIIGFKNLGLVKNIFNNFHFKTKTNSIAIGHIRYSTRKKTSVEIKLKETQPFIGDTRFCSFSLAHNGNIPNINSLIKEYELNIKTHSDTEVVVRFIEYLTDQYNNFDDALIYVLNKIPGVYCFVIMTTTKLYAMRDSYGTRPLSIGKDVNNNICISSETCSFSDKFKFIRDVQPGELVSIDLDKNIKTIHQKAKRNMFCSFEYIYFMNYKSKKNNKHISDVRFKLGYQMGLSFLNNKYKNFIVVGVPNSSIPAAQGFAAATKLPYKNFIIKRNDVNRTFILPSEKQRINACKKKFIFDSDGLKGSNMFLVDDSIVRGTTMKTIVESLRQIGVLQIHLIITSPPIKSPCYLGIDMSTKNELIAHNKKISLIANQLNVDNLTYLDTEKMKDIFVEPVCTSCFTNNGNFDRQLFDW